MRPEPLRAAELDTAGLDHGLGVVEEASWPQVLARARQVHGSAVVRVAAGGLESGTRADGLYTSAAGLAIGVITADCVPVLLADPARRVVACVHAGWRGTGKGIAGVAVRELERATGVRPRELLAVIGPAIGACCYEVDAPVRAAIDCPPAFAPGRPGHFQLDLRLANRLTLLRAGVPESRIVCLGACTCCGRPTLPSYRRDRASGRMLHWIRL